MKVLVLTLALTILTGSQAFVLRDEAKSKVEELEQEMHACADKVLRSFFRKAEMVIESEIFKALYSKAEDIHQKLYEFSRALKDAVPPEVNQVDDQLESALRDTESKIFREMYALKRNLRVEKRAFEEALKSDLNPVLENLDPYTQPLRQSLLRTCEELDERLTEVLKPHLEKLQPLAKEIPDKLEKVGDSFNSIIDWMQKSIITEVENARDALQKSASHVLRVINKYSESFDQWVNAPLFPGGQ